MSPENTTEGLYTLGNHPDGVRAICKECERIVLADSEAEAGEIVESHNNQMHDGDDVAGICAWDVRPIEELLPNPEEVGWEKTLDIMLSIQS